MGTKMNNAPVYFALAQVRFNPILTLDRYLPAIQDSLRKCGFPDFQKTFVSAINFNFGGPAPEQPMPAVVAQTRYLFMNEDRTWGFVLDQANLTIQTTRYDTFDLFLATFLKGMKIVHENAELSFAERLGIRYLDAAIPADTEKVALYLSPSVLGLSEEFPERNLIHSVSETRTEQDHSTLVSRAVIYKQNENIPNLRVAFPADLIPDPLKVEDKFASVRGVYAVIDTDCWYENRERFDVGAIEKRLRYLRSEARRSFDLMVTPYALKSWE